MLHEAAFLALSAFAILRLVAAGPGGNVALIAWWTLLALSIAGAWLLTKRRQSTLRWRVRFGSYLLIMNAAYVLIGPTVRALGSPLRDAQLQAIDSTLFGKPLPLYFDALTSPVTSEILSLCYMVLFPYIVFSVGRMVWRMPRAFEVTRLFFVGLFTMYAAGFLGYLLVPARGAYLDIPHAFSHPIQGMALTRLNDDIVRRGSSGVDVFPSLHVAVSTFILFFDLRYARWRFYAYLAPAIGLWVATLYLRYHYGVDVIAGFLFAAAALGLVSYEARRHASNPDYANAAQLR